MQIIKKKLDKLEDGFYLFTTENCPTCEKLKNILNEVTVDVKLSELNAYEHQDICISLSLMGTPCLIDYRKDKEYDRMYGAASLERVETFLKGE